MSSTLSFLGFFAAILFWLMLWLGPFCGALWLGYYLFSLRLRRQERTRFMLDLAETGMKTGYRIEDTFISAARSRDRSLGVRFHLLAAYLEKGLSLTEALEKVPRLLPFQIGKILQVGIQIGDIGKVLPACRQVSKDAVSQTRGAINYLITAAFVGLPLNIFVISALQIWVMPQLRLVFLGMQIPHNWAMNWMTADRGILIFSLQLLLIASVWIATIIYIGGPTLFFWCEKSFKPLLHWIIYVIPWRKKRLQRDFSTMLAILIDAAVPEPEAVALAADCTDNLIFQWRAKRAIAALGQGMSLPEALRFVDDTGEFHWRLVNALHGQTGFFAAIRGWNESLDAKAYQQEQASAQMITTGMVLFNGALIGLIVVSIFSILVSIIDTGVLW